MHWSNFALLESATGWSKTRGDVLLLLPILGFFPALFLLNFINTAITNSLSAIGLCLGRLEQKHGDLVNHLLLCTTSGSCVRSQNLNDFPHLVATALNQILQQHIGGNNGS